MVVFIGLVFWIGLCTAAMGRLGYSSLAVHTSRVGLIKGSLRMHYGSSMHVAPVSISDNSSLHRFQITAVCLETLQQPPKLLVGLLHRHAYRFEQLQKFGQKSGARPTSNVPAGTGCST